MPVRLIDVCDAAGGVLETGLLSAAESVHRQLRPLLPGDYTAKMLRIFASGARMLVAVTQTDQSARAVSPESARVAGVAVWRLIDNTYEGLRFYVDDLVTDEAQRSSGVGKAMLDGLRARAVALKADSFALDSGTQRQQAHKFYFREGMVIAAFSFKQTLAR